MISLSRVTIVKYAPLCPVLLYGDKKGGQFDSLCTMSGIHLVNEEISAFCPRTKPSQNPGSWPTFLSPQIIINRLPWDGEGKTSLHQNLLK